MLPIKVAHRPSLSRGIFRHKAGAEVEEPARLVGGVPLCYIAFDNRAYTASSSVTKLGLCLFTSWRLP
jgi:hypothetical protein